MNLLWEDTLLRAAVIKERSNGAVEVAFKKDGSIGKNLTKNRKHGAVEEKEGKLLGG